ncbi:unnamed protein product, partial [Ectocarpus sp. 12 AP-2014]
AVTIPGYARAKSVDDTSGNFSGVGHELGAVAFPEHVRTKRNYCTSPVSGVIPELGAVAIPGHGRSNRADCPPKHVSAVGAEQRTVAIPGQGRKIRKDCTSIVAGGVGDERYVSAKRDTRLFRIDSPAVGISAVQ